MLCACTMVHVRICTYITIYADVYVWCIYIKYNVCNYHNYIYYTCIVCVQHTYVLQHQTYCIHCVIARQPCLGIPLWCAAAPHCNWNCGNL